ncbi:hypothetical protein D5086_030549 [Populus alba]|uniref:Uncharacterized protein n=1 Tax=Populus alba TaxID=43335 RepID=A0ACC4ANT5_POPAL
MVQPCDTTQVRLVSDFGVKSATVQVYSNSHNSQSDRWIGLIFYVDSPDISYYLGLTIQVNRSSGRNRNTGQQRAPIRNQDCGPTISPFAGHQFQTRTLVQPSAHSRGTSSKLGH